jgi:hypothetical protein
MPNKKEKPVARGASWKMKVLDTFNSMFGPYDIAEMTIIGEHFDLLESKLPTPYTQASQALGAFVIKIHLDVMKKGKS